MKMPTLRPPKRLTRAWLRMYVGLVNTALEKDGSPRRFAANSRNAMIGLDEIDTRHGHSGDLRTHCIGSPRECYETLRDLDFEEMPSEYERLGYVTWKPSVVHVVAIFDTCIGNRRIRVLTETNQAQTYAAVKICIRRLGYSRCALVRLERVEGRDADILAIPDNTELAWICVNYMGIGRVLVPEREEEIQYAESDN